MARTIDQLAPFGAMDGTTRGALRLDVLTRVSRTMGREGDSYGSPEVQLKDCRAWIAANGHVEGEHFHEENVSGGALLARRPGLQAVIERMRDGDSDGVVVRAYDRFMRSVALSWEVIELIEGRDGVGGIGRLFAAQGNVDFRTPTGRLLFTQLQSLAQYQRENARQEWAVARTRAWERGVWLARAPLGYVKVDAALKHAPAAGDVVVGAGGARFDAAEVTGAVVGGLVRCPRRGPIMSELFERRRDGEPVADLARWLGEQTGKPWAPTVVTKMLRNRAYLGEASLHRAERDRGSGAVVARHLLATRRNDHLPLTSEVTFRAVQQVRTVRRVGPGDARASHLLVGFVRCAGCRYMLRACDNGTGVRAYMCVAEHGMGRCTAPVYANAAALEEFVLRAVLALDDVDVAARERRDDLDRMREHVDELRAQVLRLVGQLRRSRHPDLIQVELDHAELELEAAERKLADLERHARASGGRTRSLAQILSAGTADEKRAVLAAYLDRVVVRRGEQPLAERALLLLRGEERAFEPLPARGRKVALAPWPAFPAHGSLQQAG
jgi:DNA invertase Pin-like site-specific DNA recombinase